MIVRVLVSTPSRSRISARPGEELGVLEQRIVEQSSLSSISQSALSGDIVGRFVSSMNDPGEVAVATAFFNRGDR